MEILTNYSEDTLQLISDGTSYSLPEINETHTFKLSVFNQSNSFLGNFTLEQNKDFYIKNNQLFLKPNEYLDRNGFSEANYNLQFDFLKRKLANFHISQISPSRKEIRLSIPTVSISTGSRNDITEFMNDGEDSYAATGEYTIGNYIGKDLQRCKSLVESIN